MYFSSLIAVWDFSYLDFKSFLFSFFFKFCNLWALWHRCQLYFLSLFFLLCWQSVQLTSLSPLFIERQLSPAQWSEFSYAEYLSVAGFTDTNIANHDKRSHEACYSLMLLLTSSNLTQLYSVLVILPYNWVPPNMCGVIIATSKVLWRHLYDVKHNTTIDDSEARPSRY